jgi:hypothetical protein
MHDDHRDRPIGHSNSLVQKERSPIPWIWEGLVAEGAVTLLSAPEKVGKTTLLSLLLDRRRAGGQLLGRTVHRGKTILCSEESLKLWSLRQPPLDFGSDLVFHQPDGDYPSRGRWKRFVDDVFTLLFEDSPFGLLVIDTAASFLPLADRNKRVLRWALAQLSLVADTPAGVLVLNQSRNVHRPLAAFADIVIEMEIPRGPPHPTLSPTPGGEGRVRGATRRRGFTGVGRYPDTLQTARAELNAEGTDYVLLPDSPEPPPPLLATLQTLLTESPTPLTGRELLARWPGDAPCPNRLWRTLTRGVERGLFVVTGAGTKTDAFRYGVAEPARTKQQADGTE